VVTDASGERVALNGDDPIDRHRGWRPLDTERSVGRGAFVHEMEAVAAERRRRGVA
jgi:hypothetical protein